MGDVKCSCPNRSEPMVVCTDVHGASQCPRPDQCSRRDQLRKPVWVPEFRPATASRAPYEGVKAAQTRHNSSRQVRYKGVRTVLSVRVVACNWYGVIRKLIVSLPGQDCGYRGRGMLRAELVWPAIQAVESSPGRALTAATICAVPFASSRSGN